MKFKMNTIFICIIFLLLGILLASIIFPNKCVEGFDLTIGEDGCWNGEEIPGRNATGCLGDLVDAANDGTLCDPSDMPGNVKKILRHNIEQGNNNLINYINGNDLAQRYDKASGFKLSTALNNCRDSIILEQTEDTGVTNLGQELDVNLTSPPSLGGTLTATDVDEGEIK